MVKSEIQIKVEYQSEIKQEFKTEAEQNCETAMKKEIENGTVPDYVSESINAISDPTPHSSSTLEASYKSSKRNLLPDNAQSRIDICQIRKRCYSGEGEKRLHPNKICASHYGQIEMLPLSSMCCCFLFRVTTTQT